MFNQCDCSDLIHCQRTLKNGVVQIGTQCLKCGSWKAIKATSLTRREHSDALCNTYDETLRERYYQQQKTEYDAKRAEENQAWWDWYNEYLSSEQWKKKAARVKQRDNHICRGCLIKRADVVHHLTYAHVGDEPLFDLVSMCYECHNKLHNKD